MTGILQFLYLFFIICLGLVLFITLYNIYTKSYKPKRATIFAVAIVLLYSLTSFLGMLAVTNLSNNLPINFEFLPDPKNNKPINNNQSNF